jgi:hypothetical protein
MAVELVGLRHTAMLMELAVVGVAAVASCECLNPTNHHLGET